MELIYIINKMGSYNFRNVAPSKYVINIFKYKTLFVLNIHK